MKQNRRHVGGSGAKPKTHEGPAAVHIGSGFRRALDRAAFAVVFHRALLHCAVAIGREAPPGAPEMSSHGGSVAPRTPRSNPLILGF